MAKQLDQGGGIEASKIVTFDQSAALSLHEVLSQFCVNPSLVIYQGCYDDEKTESIDNYRDGDLNFIDLNETQLIRAFETLRDIEGCVEIKDFESNGLNVVPDVMNYLGDRLATSDNVLSSHGTRDLMDDKSIRSIPSSWLGTFDDRILKQLELCLLARPNFHLKINDKMRRGIIDQYLAVFPIRRDGKRLCASINYDGPKGMEGACLIFGDPQKLRHPYGHGPMLLVSFKS